MVVLDLPVFLFQLQRRIHGRGTALARTVFVVAFLLATAHAVDKRHTFDLFPVVNQLFR
ncbi:hypothetical protein SDC9_125347 [bioreactor metagenome]|uniref:Uncharacterized protein n=1 Tax=bioreactor metagenome TaxID=1076179 RepID=A0A645CMT4_9ZZZZ